MDDFKAELMAKIDELRPKFKAENKFYPEGEKLDCMRFRDTENIARRILNGSAFNPAVSVDEIKEDIEKYVNKGLDDAAYGDYYYRYEKEYHL